MGNKHTYSKMIPVVTGIVFIACIIMSYVFPLVAGVQDFSYYVTSIGVTGSVFAISIMFYSKKAQAENTAKLKIELYKVSVSERLYFNKEMMRLKKQYELSDEDIMDIDESGDMDEMMKEAFDSASSSIDDSMSSATSEITYEQLG